MGDTITLHGTAVALDGRAVLIRGRSGTGKSALALQLIALGAMLIADDQVVLTRRGDDVIASCPPALRGVIEARGMGILRARPTGPAPLACVVDLDTTEVARLPEWHSITLVGCAVPLFQKPPYIDLAAALMIYLRGGRSA
ncbi:Hpr(Ser) kinase/phosphatase [Loktanella fryxellensis]|uniref:Hpr(Ser) kinase/phosphatase n=1 Tax=Loktanella fryxellensis TaxID=245187 RepID=A0A1H8ILL7_9RHOB|nr:HPr kinase/phosphatase C-terminal domain-containing protein [Loktanella fryxellensis]SEN68827.1 Hpr(Ser) kinase/phosphatase [Loktanella fryxellensis]